MPTENALKIMDEAVSIGFKGKVAFHHMSEPFLDNRIIEMAHEARKRGLTPYEHTNGDVLRKNPDLCEQAAGVFEYIVVGLYDHKNEEERLAEETFWKKQLKGTTVKFSVVDAVFPRCNTPFDDRMFREKNAHSVSPCIRPLNRMIIHYDGNMALCCEDMSDMFDLGNAFEQSVEKLWYSDKHIEIINDLQKGYRYKYAACKNCPMPELSDANWYKPQKRVDQILHKIKRYMNQ